MQRCWINPFYTLLLFFKFLKLLLYFSLSVNPANFFPPEEGITKNVYFLVSRDKTETDKARRGNEGGKKRYANIWNVYLDKSFSSSPVVVVEAFKMFACDRSYADERSHTLLILFAFYFIFYFFPSRFFDKVDSLTCQSFFLFCYFLFADSRKGFRRGWL